MGEGHNAAGRALHAAAQCVWPSCRIEWLDVLEVMGAGSGPLFRRVYVTSVQRLPWLYDAFYRAVRRYRWLAVASKRVIGAWAGRRLAPHLDRIRPDLVLSTYPMASSGLEWLRRHRGWDVPTGAWVSDFAPHPSWVHADLEMNLVMHQIAVAAAVAGVPGARVLATAPPVDSCFRPGDRAGARRRWQVPAGVFLAVVTCGSLGFGRVDRSVRELLDADTAAMVIVVAGRNAPLRRRLAERLAGQNRVRVLGWVEDMAALMVAADVVVTNAGGLTALEALACGRPLIMHYPIAGHGRANAELMARAGLAAVCARPGELAELVRRLREQPSWLAQWEAAALGYARSHLVEDGLLALASAPRVEVDRVLSSADALYLHVQTAEVPQHVGAVMMFEPVSDGSAPTPADVAGLLAGLSGLAGRLRPATLLRRARWSVDGTVDPRTMIEQVSAGHAGALTEIIDDFFARPLDAARPPATALLVTGLPDDRRAVLVKLHHSLGDGVAVLRALLAGTEGAGRSWATPPSRSLTRTGLRDGGAVRLLRGLWVLARAGRANGIESDRHSSGPARHYELMRLRGRSLRAAARAVAVTDTELLITIFAEAASRVLAVDPAGPATLRLMVPWSLRGTQTARASGNCAGAVPVDLPVGPMAWGDRVAVVRAAVRARAGSAVPEAAGFVVRAFGVLPPGLQSAAARAVYRSTWFDAIGSVLPGPRWQVRLGGALLSAAYPVLPLATGVGLSWGAITWGEWIAVCLTGTAGSAGRTRALASAIVTVAADLAATPAELSTPDEGP
ncbi:MAG: glycosyltransferase [Kutzneria sp.]|nr:glycosyltransferase [Kutzneria sp.]